jgi:hypothetical protein
MRGGFIALPKAEVQRDQTAAGGFQCACHYSAKQLNLATTAALAEPTKPEDF